MSTSIHAEWCRCSRCRGARVPSSLGPKARARGLPFHWVSAAVLLAGIAAAALLEALA